MRKIVLLWTLGVSVACLAAQPSESHVQDIVERVGQCVRRLKAADPEAVPMAFWDFDGTIIKGDIGIGLTDGGRVCYRSIIGSALEEGYSSIYRGAEAERRWRDDLARFNEIGPWLTQAFDVQMFAGARTADLTACAARKIREGRLDRWYFASSMAIWRALEKAGVLNFVVSANVEPLLRGAAESLGVEPERINACRAEVVAGRVTTKVVYPLLFGPGKTEAVRAIVQSRPHGVAVAGFGDSYRTDGDFLRYIGTQSLPGGARPLAVMINGGETVSGYSEHFLCVEQSAVVGNVGPLTKEECE